MSNKVIKIESLSKNYSDVSGYTVQLFENITFDVETKKLTTILAPKGAGKSTLMEMIAGIDVVSENLNGKRIFIPTKSSSFPWLNVHDNILFNLKNIDDKDFKNVIQFVGLEGYEDHYPNNNSVGFRFRVSLARAIINNPELILIDESVSTLPLKRKLEFYSLLRKVTSEKGIPILYSTSSVSEAIRLSDRIILMSQFPAEIICRKSILIDEEVRINDNSVLSIPDYFTEEEIKVLSDSFI